MIHKNICFEVLHNNLGQYIKIDRILCHKNSDQQDILIFENSYLGRVMMLDGIVQTTELDEFIYHEMITHVPLVANGNAENVLIIGGGDGATLREVAKHEEIKQITMVEIDDTVIDLCKKYLPNHCANSYKDKRLKLIIDDGVNFIKWCQDKFDIIISDCTDPVGPGKSLFTSDFYYYCCNALNDNGIFVAQNGVSFLQKNKIIDSYHKLNKYFTDVSFYQATIPTYYGGAMIFAWASNNSNLRKLSSEIIQERFKSKNIKHRYYSPAIHCSSFILPRYLLNELHN